MTAPRDSVLDDLDESPRPPALAAGTILDRARAEVAYEARLDAERAVAERARQEEMDLKRLCRFVRDVLGEDAERFTLERVTVEQRGDNEPWTGEYPAVTIEGLTFTLSIHYGTDLGLVRECPKCGTKLVEVVTYLGDIARKHDAPVSHWRCPENKAVPTPLSVEPTVEQRFLDAVKDLIRQESST